MQRRSGTDWSSCAARVRTRQAINELYADDIVSIEAVAPQEGGEQVTNGIEGVLAKNQWFSENHEIHDASVAGPFPHDDRFAVLFKYDVTHKPSGQRMQMEEVGLFTVADGKVAKEEFFYSM